MGTQRKKIVRRIINNAKEEFIARGYKETNVDDLAKASGISKATLYKYITNKEQLYIKCLTEHINEFGATFTKFAKEIMKVDEATFFSKFFAIIEISSKYLETTNKICSDEEKKRFPDLAKKLQIFASKQIETNYNNFLNKGKELGLIKKEVDDIILFHIINYSLMNLSVLHSKLLHKFSATQLLYKYFTIIFKGILNEKAFPIYNQQIKEIIYEY